MATCKPTLIIILECNKVLLRPTKCTFFFHSEALCSGTRGSGQLASFCLPTFLSRRYSRGSGESHHLESWWSKGPAKEIRQNCVLEFSPRQNMDDPSAHHAYWMKAKMQRCTDYRVETDSMRSVIFFFWWWWGPWRNKCCMHARGSRESRGFTVTSGSICLPCLHLHAA